VSWTPVYIDFKATFHFAHTLFKKRYYIYKEARYISNFPFKGEKKNKRMASTFGELPFQLPFNAAVLTGGAVALMGLFVANRARDRLDQRETNGIPGTRGWPILDETLPFAISPRQFFRDGFDKHGPYFRTRVMGKDVVLISGNAGSNMVYCNEDAFGVRMFDPLMKLLEGFMLIQNGKEHKKNRGLIVRALSDAQLRSNVKGIAEAFQEELKCWSNNTNGKVEIFSSVKKAILIVMMKVLFGNSTISPREINDLVKEFECYGKGFLAVVSATECYDFALCRRRRE
jgi:hypothetical protein